jgi:4-amino-4-deoxy-L-arabinose transferase-like glycosyltransferase
MIEYLKSKTIPLLVIVITALILLPFLGNVHLFDWDEINFAECAREMVTINDYLQVKIDYNHFWEKPPLFMWTQAAMFKTFGVNEFAARLPNALVGIITIFILFNISKKIFNTNFGLIWTLVYLGSFLPHFYFKSGIIDPIFNLFMFLSIYFIYKQYILKQQGNASIIIAGIFSGLAILTKGPVGFLLPSLIYLTFIIIKRKEIIFKFREIGFFCFFAIIISCTWFGFEIFTNGFWSVGEFIKYQIRLFTTGDAGHGGPVYYHFVILLFGCFPASVFVFNKIYGKNNLSIGQIGFRTIMIITLVVVLIVFSIVKTKIIHYSSLAYIPITFLTALSIDKIIKKEIKINFINYAGIILIGLIYSILLISIPILMFNKEKLLPHITDNFVKGNLSMDVKWYGWEAVIGVVFLVALIVSLILFIKQKNQSAYLFLFGSVIFTILLFLPIVAPKIETHTQGAPIAFYKKLRNSEAYVQVLGFKSYSHLFYTQKPYHLSPASLNMTEEQFYDFLLTGPITKPAYFVCKIQDEKKWSSNPNLIELYTQGGFAFFKRLPVKSMN